MREIMQQQIATAEELQEILDYCQSCYKNDDAKITAALCVSLMVHLRTLLFADNNLAHTEGAVTYLNNSIHALITEWQQSRQGKTFLH
jgi:hypothetical protein